jgi:hypothetical protein
LMARILCCTTDAGDWQRFLSDPETHWRSGYSARTLAHAWEAANGFPPEVSTALASAKDGLLQQATPFFAVPEYEVPLPGGHRASQTDLMVFGRAEGGAFAVAVEGKVAESFGPTLGEWDRTGSAGRQERWSYLCRELVLSEGQPESLRYQLFHRAASALIAARQVHARLAVLLVHSFSEKDVGLDDFRAWTRLFGAEPAVGEVALLRSQSDISLYCGWVRGESKFAAM